MAVYRAMAVWLACLMLWSAVPVAAQPAPKPATAQIDLTQSGILAAGRDKGRPRPLFLTLSLDKSIPYRAYLVASPPRLVLDFRKVDFDGVILEQLAGADVVEAIRWGSFRHGWTRMVVQLPWPVSLDSVTLEGKKDPAGQPLEGFALDVVMRPVAEADFNPRGGHSPASALWDLPDPAEIRPMPPRESNVLRIMLDPGHGGIDPGATAGDMSEAGLMLTFATELAELLRRAGAEVFMTRESDMFLGLDQRTSLARAAGADIFVSLHADALPDGGAAGTAFYVWNPQADDRSSRQLAMQHDRDDLLAGLDLSGTTDEILDVLIDMSRTETQPRSQALANFMVSEAARAGLPMHRRPLQGADFRVLKSPDIPSVLVETGFLTDPDDRARLSTPSGRAALVRALATSILSWSRDDRLRAPLLRQ